MACVFHGLETDTSRGPLNDPGHRVCAERLALQRMREAQKRRWAKVSFGLLGGISSGKTVSVLDWVTYDPELSLG